MQQWLNGDKGFVEIRHVEEIARKHRRNSRPTLKQQQQQQEQEHRHVALPYGTRSRELYIVTMDLREMADKHASMDIPKYLFA